MNSPALFRLGPVIFVVGLIAIACYPIEQIAFKILAPQDDAHSLPVYAQFTVTQVMQFDRPITIDGLAIPLHLPAAGQPLQIRLRAGDEVVQEWLLSGELAGVVEASFALTQPYTLQGEVSVELDGREIAHAQREQAPRVFVEPDAAAYTGGHYQIANNSKQGDVALSFIKQRPYGQVWYERWQTKPAGLAAQVLFIGLALGLLSALPRPTQTEVRTSPRTNPQTA